MERVGWLKQIAVLLPLAVADPSGRTVYVRNTQDGIDAFALDSGRTLWTTSAACRPLVVVDGRLLALSDSRLLGFDAGGTKVFESDPLPLPEWASVRGAGTERSSNVLEVEPSLQGGTLTLEWSARLAHAYGIAVDPERSGDRSARGSLEVDLATGKVAPKESALPTPAPPELPDGYRRGAGDLYWLGGHYGGEPVPLRTAAGALVMLVVSHASGERFRLRLERFSRGPVELDDWHELVALSVDLDRSHVLVHSTPLAKIFSLDTGELVAKLEAGLLVGEARLEHGYTVHAGRLIHVAERRELADERGRTIVRRTLRALTLRSAKLAWERRIEGYVEYPPVP
jgi:hypothetical protein